MDLLADCQCHPSTKIGNSVTGKQKTLIPVDIDIKIFSKILSPVTFLKSYTMALFYPSTVSLIRDLKKKNQESWIILIKHREKHTVI